MTTGFIGDNQDRLTEAPRPSANLLQWAAAGLAQRDLPVDHRSGARQFLRKRFGFRLNGPARREVSTIVNGEVIAVEVGDHALRNSDNRSRYWPASDREGRALVYFEDGAAFGIAAQRIEGSGTAITSSGAIVAPMPGRVTSVDVAAGDTVTRGQKLLTLEAMKMEHALTSPFDGIVAELNATPGDQVQVDAVLARVEAEA